VSPELVLDPCRYLGEAADHGMSFFSTLLASSGQLILLHYPDIVFQEHQR
jgi:hypothetical protein